MQWKGPFEVVERTERHDYSIQLADRQKIFYAKTIYIPHKAEISESLPESELPDNSANQVTSAVILESEEDLNDQGSDI